jgi:hypothetical protein
MVGFRVLFVCMCFIALRKLVVLLTSLAFLVGVGAQAMPSARLMGLHVASAGHTLMGEDCATMAVNGGAVEQEPCKRISFDCATQLGCICSPALPAPPTALTSPVAWELLSYWPRLAAAPAELSIKPDLHPPIGA